MAKVVKMCDMPVQIALKVFEALNYGKVKTGITLIPGGFSIITNTEPKDLVYPEGWYYAKGAFCNKHTSTTGKYYEVHMWTEDCVQWREKAIYCTLDQAFKPPQLPHNQCGQSRGLFFYIHDKPKNVKKFMSLNIYSSLADDI